MVALKWFLVSALTSVSVLAQAPPPEVDAADLTAYWDVNLSDTVGTTPGKRGIVHSRNTMVNPYQGDWCPLPYKQPPCGTSCNRNNCFRAFLNARSGSSEQHCPQEAFGFCCLWNAAPTKLKYWGLQTGLVLALAPYTEKCDCGEDYWATIAKIDDVCGCTLDGKVTVDKDSTYVKLAWAHPGNKVCHS